MDLLVCPRVFLFYFASANCDPERARPSLWGSAVVGRQGADLMRLVMHRVPLTR